ncbi:MAG TPA: NAD(P)H-binding protein [Nitrospira sp.]|nr:NAD(P)H-binding protein [Nitrospira sp.]
MWVVFGATGHTGSVVAETLLSRRQPVRVLVRSADKAQAWKAGGAQVALGSLDDMSVLRKALEGAAGAYVLLPPNYGAVAWMTEQRRRIDQIAEALRTAQTPHVVFLSSVGAHRPSGTGPIRALHYGEQRLKTAVQRLTVLRPAYFLDNWAAGIAPARQHGVLPTFITPTKTIPMISTEDIGRIAAEQLLAGGKPVIELAGPEDYSPNQVAAALGDLLRRPVTAQHAPLNAVVPTFKSFGFSDEAAELFREMYEGLESDRVDYEQPVNLVRGTVTLSEALRRMVQDSERS